MIFGPAAEASAVEAVLLGTQAAGAGLHPLDRALALVRVGGMAEDDPATWPIARRDQALLNLAANWFGDTMACLATCPDCRAVQEFELSAGDMAATIGVPSVERLEIHGWTVTLVPLTSRDLAATAMAPDMDAAVALLAARAISLEAQGGAAGDLDAVDAQARAAMLTRIEAREAVGEMLLYLDCPDCAHRWSERFDPGGWLWDRVNAAAGAIIIEVAALARAFGWSEGDILAMPRSRRLAYLERVAG